MNWFSWERTALALGTSSLGEGWDMNALLVCTELYVFGNNGFEGERAGEGRGGEGGMVEILLKM